MQGLLFVQFSRSRGVYTQDNIVRVKNIKKERREKVFNMRLGLVGQYKSNFVVRQILAGISAG